MSIKLSKARSILLVAAVVLSNIAVMGEFATFPIIDALYERFPNQSFWVDTWMSINQWTIVIFSIVASALLKKMSKRTFLILGGAIFTLSGVFGAAGENIILMVVIRAFYGIGVAFCNVGAVAVVAEVYTDEDKMNRVMGIYNALQGALGALISMIGGYMAAVSWTQPFKLLWTGVPMILIFAFCIPYIKPEQTEEKAMEKGGKQPMGVAFWLTTAAFIIFATAYSIPSQYSSSYVIENGIGDEVISGYLGSLSTAGSFVFCLFYDKMYQKLNRRVIVLWYGLAAALMVIMFFVPNQILIFPLYFIIGGSMSIACTYTYSVIPNLVPESRVDDGIGVMTAACCVGYGLAPYFSSLMQRILGTADITPVVICSAIVCALSATIEFCLSRKKATA